MKYKVIACIIGLSVLTPIKSLAAGCGGASWYGPGFHGKTTASGEKFNQNALTAAHKKLKFGTRVRVTDPKTGKSVIVKINDRGPFIKGRIIDLSKEAAKKLGIKSKGIAKVCIKIM